MQLRDYQQDTEFEINQAWLAVKNVLAVLPTGAGKTVLFAKILNDHVGAACAIVHRQKLVTQISVALARFGVSHKIIAPNKLIHSIVREHVEKTGRSYYNPSALIAVAGVDTLNRRVDKMRTWMNSVTLWVTDEGHHISSNGGEPNKWMKACNLFPNAKGLSVTATACRADGAGLGRHADGVIDCMVEGPKQRELIDRGFLTDYKILAPPSDLDLKGVKITASGELSKNQVDNRIDKSHIFGDVVREYLKHARGRLGITFAHNVEAANDIAERFNAAGVPAAAISYETDLTDQIAILKRFENRQLLQLVNVDMFGEGFDLPAIEVVSFARPTASFPLFVQQAGRVLRVMVDPEIDKRWGEYTDDQRKAYIAASVKPKALIIDHVGNVKRHARVVEENGRMTIELCHRIWSLDRREKSSRKKHDPDLIPLKTCKKCTGLYEAIYDQCPYCGALDVPATRSSPKEVDGDLSELDPSVLKAMRGEVDKIDRTVDKLPIQRALIDNNAKVRGIRNHLFDQETQVILRDTLSWYGGYCQSQGMGKPECQKRFFFRFNIDMLSAKALKRKDAEELNGRVKDYLTSVGVVIR